MLCLRRSRPQNPRGLRPLGLWPWDLPRHSIHHDTSSAFSNNVPIWLDTTFITVGGAEIKEILPKKSRSTCQQSLGGSVKNCSSVLGPRASPSSLGPWDRYLLTHLRSAGRFITNKLLPRRPVEPRSAFPKPSHFTPTFHPHLFSSIPAVAFL